MDSTLMAAIMAGTFIVVGGVFTLGFRQPHAFSKLDKLIGFLSRYGCVAYVAWYLGMRTVLDGTPGLAVGIGIAWLCFITLSLVFMFVSWLSEPPSKS